MMTLPKEWDGPPDFSTLTGNESDNGGLKKVTVNIKRSISLYVKDRREECDVRVGRLLKSDNEKSSILRMQKKYGK